MAGVLAAALAGCATVQNPVTGERERSVMSVADEIALGAKQHEQVLADYGVVDDKALQAYVDGIGQRLARSSQRPGLQWHFTVLDSPEINAFALPGGYVYVTRGIMAYMDSEAELAGVVGHEIGHVTARHGAQRATRQQDAGLGVLAATVLGAVLESQGVAGAGRTAQQVSQGVAAGYVASYSREQELQADRLGADYLAGGGYSPQNMVDVIELLKNQERFAADAARAAGRAVPQGGGWLASHPSNDQRLAAIRQVAAGFQGRYGDDGRQRYLKQIDGMGFGDGREQGVVRGQQFFHEPLGFAITAPAGWQVRNATDALTLVNAAGDAGLVLRAVPASVTASSGTDHAAILRTLLKAEPQRSERRNLNGLPATHFEAVARNAQGQAQALAATIVSGPGGRAYVLGYAARDAAALQRARDGLRDAEGSFRALTASDRAAARPWQLRAVPFPRGGFAELARQSTLGAEGEAQLRLINGVYGNDRQLAVGQPVKTVR